MTVPTSARTLKHTRAIEVQVFLREDGLWDVEARIADTKSRDFPLATGVRPAGEPIHDMTLCVTVDTRLSVLDAHARSTATPYPGYCDTIGESYRELVGLNLLRGFRQAVNERLGGKAGCTHITELAAVLPTAAIQGFAGEVQMTGEPAAGAAHASASQRPFQLDRCHALRLDGPAVLKFYPEWYRGDVAAPATANAPLYPPAKESA